MDQARLETYARLIVEKGLNLDRGQDVIVTANLDQVEFIRMVVRHCYECGAGKVVVNWSDTPLAKLAQLYQSEENLSRLEPWEEARWQWMTERFPARLWIDSDDPDGMHGVDPDKHGRSLSARLKQIKPFRDRIENKHQWCIAAVPGQAWAQKVFPGVPPDEAIEKLWEAILSASRANGDATANWNEHNATIHSRCAKLNACHFTALEYRSANGTDFKVGLMEQGVFAGAYETDLQGRVFNPNIPSEEIFTSPRRGVAEGWLVATKPLSWQGILIENFAIRFEAGRAVELKAEKGLPILEKMIAMDEGASFLGECALIADDSPINNTGILFYNTLFDENASCHVALGRGFDNCIENYEQYTPEEIRAMGVNDSAIHVDFMIGCKDLAITGVTADGAGIPIFRHGNWCF